MGTGIELAEGVSASPSQGLPAPEHDLRDLPFGDRLLGFLEDPDVRKLLKNEGEVLPFRVRSGDVTEEIQADADRYVKEDYPDGRGGRVVLRSPNLPKPEGTSTDDPFGPLSGQEFLGLRARLLAELEDAARRDSLVAHGYLSVTFELRDGDMLRPLPKGIESVRRRDSGPPLLMEHLRDFSSESFPNGCVRFEGGFPSPDSLESGSPDIMKMRSLLLRQENHKNVPADLADAVFLERTYELKPINDPSELHFGQWVVVVVDGYAIPSLVDQSLKPTNNLRRLSRVIKFGSDSLRPPQLNDSPRRRPLPLGMIAGQTPGSATVVTALVQSVEQSADGQRALLYRSESTFPNSLSRLSVDKPEEGPILLSYDYVDPHLMGTDSPPTYMYKLEGSPTDSPTASPFRVYGLVKKSV